MSQVKTELYPLDEINKDVITLISSYLDKTDEPQVIKSLRRRHFPLFRTDVIQTNRILAKLAQYALEGNIVQVANLLNIRPDLRLNVLFTLAGLGAQDEMELILRQHPEDLLAYRPLRDISGAVFESISLFKHAIWTKDVFYMANMMLDCLPQNAWGEEIRLKLVDQYKELITNGVVYHLHGIRHENESHFSLQPLITALRTYQENYKNWTEENKNVHWRTVVGLEQTKLPAHIRHHYCDPEEDFQGTPNFKKPKLKRSLQIYIWTENKSQLWSEAALIGLGKEFGIYGPTPSHSMPWADKHGVNYNGNLEALEALDKVRSEVDMPALIERLHTPILNLEADLSIQGIEFES